MIAHLEAEALDTEVFTTLVDVELTDRDGARHGGWSSDTRLSLLAWEITSYMPELAADLERSGRRRMALATKW